MVRSKRKSCGGIVGIGATGARAGGSRFVRTLAVLTAWLWLALGAAQGARVLVLIADGFFPDEFWQPYEALLAAGHEVVVAAPEAGTVQSGRPFEGAVALGAVDPAAFDALVIPGGQSPARLASVPGAHEICTRMLADSKLVGAICHGPRLLMTAGALSNRVHTSVWLVKDELPEQWRSRAHGPYVDQAVVRDGSLITSRCPWDSAAFGAAMVAALEPAGAPAAALPPGSAVVAAAEGADDRVVAAMLPWLSAQGRIPRLMGHTNGWLRGAAGVPFAVEGTYAAPPPLASRLWVVLPGAVWPEPPALEAARIDWAVNAYSNGATLAVFGLDVLALARRHPALLKGRVVAASGQTLWALRDVGVTLDLSLPAAMSAPRLLTVRGAADLPAAWQIWLPITEAEKGGVRQVPPGD